MSGRDCDPLLAAGYLTCRECRATGWGHDAMWLPNGTVLVAFDAYCEHSRPRVVALDMDSEDTRVPYAPTRRPSPRRCAGVTRAGHPCRAYAMYDEEYCHAHIRRVV